VKRLEKIICLTGDVHNRSLNSSDQKVSKLTEVEASKIYLMIAEKFNIKVTLFFTGKCFSEEPLNNIKDLLSYKNLEIGGHTYYALRPAVMHNIFRRIWGQSYGPEWYQRLDIRRTVKVIKNTIGRDVLSWRTHSYASDEITYKILDTEGLRVVSDKVDYQASYPQRVGRNLLSMPINTFPDHEHIIHPGTRKMVESNKANLNKIFPIEKWCEKVEKQILNILSFKGVGVILAHPICMYVSDNFSTFIKLCDFLSQFKGIFIKDVINEFPNL
jgi:hypothetical protein